jgi:hypothetical protein
MKSSWKAQFCQIKNPHKDAAIILPLQRRKLRLRVRDKALGHISQVAEPKRGHHARLLRVKPWAPAHSGLRALWERPHSTQCPLTLLQAQTNRGISAQSLYLIRSNAHLFVMLISLIPRCMSHSWSIVGGTGSMFSECCVKQWLHRVSSSGQGASLSQGESRPVLTIFNLWKHETFQSKFLSCSSNSCTAEKKKRSTLKKNYPTNQNGLLKFFLRNFSGLSIWLGWLRKWQK